MNQNQKTVRKVYPHLFFHIEKNHASLCEQLNVALSETGWSQLGNGNVRDRNHGPIGLNDKAPIDFTGVRISPQASSPQASWGVLYPHFEHVTLLWTPMIPWYG